MDAPASPRPRRSARRALTHEGPGKQVLGVSLTQSERILFAETHVTKERLAVHYASHMHLILPHLLGRALNIVRAPLGRTKRSASQREPDGLPNRLAHRFPTNNIITIETAEHLIELVQHGALELHAASYRLDRPDRPDRLVFDLEPGEGVTFHALVDGALMLRDELRRRRLSSFALATGAKGLQVVVPIERRAALGDVVQFICAIASHLEASAPRRFTTNPAKASRRGRIFLDAVRRDPTAFTIAPYSSRARTGAPMAVPVAWEALPSLDAADALTVGELAPAKDPWDGFFDLRQRIGSAQRRGLALYRR